MVVIPNNCPYIKEAYLKGYDCGKNGANTVNAHYSCFSTAEQTAAWQEGKQDAEFGFSNRYQAPTIEDYIKKNFC